MITKLFIIFFSAAISNNFVLYRFLGICPFLGVSKKTDSALGMGLAVTFVMIVAGIITWLLKTFILDRYGLVFLQYTSFILIIATVVQVLEMYLKKYHQSLFNLFGIYLPLITTNCAILGLTLLNFVLGYSFIQVLVFSVGAGVGFIIALLIMSGIRERLELAPIPKPLKGVPIALITAGLLALAFSGFGGIL